MLQNNGESESAEVPVKPVIKKKRLIWDIQIDPDDADMAGASEEAIKMMTQSRRVSRLRCLPFLIHLHVQPILRICSSKATIRKHGMHTDTGSKAWQLSVPRLQLGLPPLQILLCKSGTSKS